MPPDDDIFNKTERPDYIVTAKTLALVKELAALNSRCLLETENYKRFSFDLPQKDDLPDAIWRETLVANVAKREQEAFKAVSERLKDMVKLSGSTGELVFILNDKLHRPLVRNQSDVDKFQREMLNDEIALLKAQLNILAMPNKIRNRLDQDRPLSNAEAEDLLGDHSKFTEFERKDSSKRPEMLDWRKASIEKRILEKKLNKTQDDKDRIEALSKELPILNKKWDKAMAPDTGPIVDPDNVAVIPAAIDSFIAKNYPQSQAGATSFSNEKLPKLTNDKSREV